MAAEIKIFGDETNVIGGKSKVLVLGATGGIGGTLTRLLIGRGYQVRALHRRADAMRLSSPQVEWVQGDAMKRTDVMAAAEGVDIIVHAVNPPGYRNWGKLVLPMIDNTIAAAEASGARIVLPGTVYNFGPDSFGSIDENSPQHPVTAKGKIRVEMEGRLEAASRRGVPVLIVRAGDFFGPGAGNNWFTQLVKPGRPVAEITVPGSVGIGHQWAYLPDVAETILRLLEKGSALPAFARYHFEGFWDKDGLQLAQAIRNVCGEPSLKIRRFPWWMVRLTAPVVPLFRELLEMRYLWQKEVRMSNRALVDLLGEEPRTPIDIAVRTTLEDFGCLPEGRRAPALRVEGPKFGAT